MILYLSKPDRVEPYFAHLICNSFNWKRLIFPVICNEIRSMERRKWQLSESPISKISWGGGEGACPQTPLISSRLQFVPSAFMPTSFPYESSTLKCYHKACSRTLPYHHPIHKTTSFTATILAQKRVCRHFLTYVTHEC